MNQHLPCYVMLRNRWHFGAQILCIPVLYAIAQSGRPTHVISRNPVAYLYQQLPWLASYHEVKGMFQAMAHIKRGCMLLSLQPSSEKNAIVALVKSCKPRVGFHRGKLFDAFWTHSLKYDASIYRGVHYLELFYAYQNHSQLPTANNIADALKAPFLSLAKQADFVCSMPNQMLSFTIMPGGGAGAFKKWGVDNFIAAAHLASQKLGLSIRLNFVLGPDEQEEQALLAPMQHSGLYVYQNLTIAEISKLIMNTHLTIANDCGPAHIAQCLQNGFIGVYDTAKPEWFYSNPLARCVVPDEVEQGIGSISVEKVADAMLQVLKIKGCV